MRKYIYEPPKNAHVSTNDLIQDLQFVAKKLNQTKISQETYSQHGKYSSSVFKRRFGTWNNALIGAKLEIAKIDFHPTDKLFENLLNVWQNKGSQPRQNDIDNPIISNIKSGVYKRRFKSWTNAIKEFINYTNETHEIAVMHFQKANRREPSLRLRYLVLKRDNFSCVQCGASPAKERAVELHIDHIVAWSKQGKTEISNLRTLCAKCNLGKSNLD